MPIDDTRTATDPGRPVSRLVVAATFTAEPLEDALSFWMRELDFPTSVEFAPTIRSSSRCSTRAACYRRTAGA